MKEKIIATFSAAVTEVFATLKHKTMCGIIFSAGVLLGLLLLAPLL